MEKRQTTDILIVGGGVIGLSVARAIRKRSSLSITVVDQGRCGREASWAAAGMLSPLAESDELGKFYDLCSASLAMYPALADELLAETGIDIGLETTGTLCVSFAGDPHRDRSIERFERHKTLGKGVELLSSQAIQAIEAELSPDVGFGVLYPNDWQVDNRRLVDALVEYAAKNHINVAEDTFIDCLNIENSRVTGAGDLSAGNTVVATGAWTSLIKLGPSPMPVTVRPIRGQIVCFCGKPGMFRHVIYSEKGYIVPRADGRILAGSTTEDVGFEKGVTPDAIKELTDMAVEISPVFSTLEISETWSGLRPFAPDAVPIIGGVQGVEGLTVATAHYRNGILLAPITAEIVAGKILDGVENSLVTSFGTDGSAATTAMRSGQ